MRVAYFLRVQDVLEIMRLAKIHVAPVAWALFTDKLTWDEWLYAEALEGGYIDKAELLAKFARQGRCVLMEGQPACCPLPSHH